MATYLSRTPSTLVAAERRKFTYSCWFKFGNTPGSAEQHFIYAAGSSNTYVRINTSGVIRFRLYDAPQDFQLETTAVYRDPSSWYHFVLQLNTPDSSSTERVKMYINGEQLTVSGSYPTQDYSGWINNTSNQEIPASGDGSCYMAEIHMCANQTYAPTTFGQTDSTTGEWKPKNVSGVSYGTNGYYLKFANSGAMGTDSSGNGNTWTVNSAGTNPQTVDTPSNNFATLNPVANVTYAQGTINTGSLKFSSVAVGYSYRYATIGVATGKWYWEVKAVSYVSGTDPFMIGITSTESTGQSYELGASANDWAYTEDGNKYTSGSGTAYGSTYTSGDVIGVAMDLDNLKLYFSKNGVWQNSGVPTSGSTGTGALAIVPVATTGLGNYFPAVADWDNAGGSVLETNFGNPSFSISSGNADANGYGNFEYAVPSGYYSLCTKNLNTYG